MGRNLEGRVELGLAVAAVPERGLGGARVCGLGKDVGELAERGKLAVTRR